MNIQTARSLLLIGQSQDQRRAPRIEASEGLYARLARRARHR